MEHVPQPGMPAPDFTLPDSERKPWTLSELRGQNVVLAFYPADWSSVCSRQLGEYAATLEEFRSNNAVVLGISVDGVESHRAWSQALNIGFPLLSDFWPHGAVAQKYGVFWDTFGISNRALFFIDPDGIVRKTWVGENPGVTPEFDVCDTVRAMHTGQA